MPPNAEDGSSSPFEVVRAKSAPVADLRDWSAEMAAIGKSSDRDSFMRIYDHYFPKVCLYLRSRGLAGEMAEECAQEAFLRMWRRAASYNPALSSVCTWLFRIARNIHIDLMRSEAKWPQAEDELDSLEDGAASFHESSAEDHVEFVNLKRRIDTLSTMQAQLMRMSYFEAKTHQEIADELAMPIGTVKSHLRRAFLKLQAQVRGDQ